MIRYLESMKNGIIPDKKVLAEAVKALGNEHPLVIQLEEAKCGLHIIRHALSQQSFHIASIQGNIIDAFFSVKKGDVDGSK